MKRKLIALAIAGAFIAPAAMADSGNVTLYGLMDMSFDATSSGNAAVGGSSVSTTKVSSGQSRIGFKGQEDVGGGTNVLWQVENGITGDTAGGVWGSRNTFVGLSGESWGTIRLGNYDSPYKSSTRGMDVFLDSIADNRNLMGWGRIQYDGRNGNSMNYESPDMGGLKLALQIVSGAEAVANQAQAKGSQYSMSGAYAANGLTGVLAYEVHDFGDGAGFCNGVANAACPATTGTLGMGALANKKERATKIGGGYSTDQFAVNLVFERTTDDIAGAGSLDHKTYYLSGKYNISGTDSVKMAFTRAGNIGSTAATDTGARQIAIGYDHAMSKRTKVYALWTRLDNDANMAYSLGAATSGTQAAMGAGADPSALSVGIKHAF